MAHRFAGNGYTVPAVHVSTGFPSRNALANNKRSIGQCWDQGASADGVCHIFISPVLAPPLDVAGTVIGINLTNSTRSID